MIANHLWQSTLFALVAGLLTLAFRQHRAAVRYSLWLAASLKFLVPFALLAGAAARLLPSPAPALRQAPWAPAVQELSEPFRASPILPAAPVRPRSASRWPAVLFSIWICGMAFHLFLWVRQWQRVRAAFRGATPLPLVAPIPVLSAKIDFEPGVFGIWRPVLLLPCGILGQLTPPQIEAILIHEMCHVRRYDNLSAALHMLVEALSSCDVVSPGKPAWQVELISEPLVPSAGVVDRRAPGRRARARL